MNDNESKNLADPAAPAERKARLKWEKRICSSIVRILFFGGVAVAKLEYVEHRHYWPDGVCRLDEGERPSIASGWSVCCPLPGSFDDYHNNFDLVKFNGKGCLFTDESEAMRVAENVVNTWIDCLYA